MAYKFDFGLPFYLVIYFNFIPIDFVGNLRYI